VIPEDDANRQIANGFQLQLDYDRSRRMQILEVAGGWGRVLERFEVDEIPGMRRFGARYLVLLIDFDDDLNRVARVKEKVPEDLTERVFVLGALDEPESLKAGLGSYEKIGSDLARDCRDGTNSTWNHVLLRHNGEEVARLRNCVVDILFQPHASGNRGAG
jgi:hypothetical protein